MGARVYNPETNQFTGPDLVKGGNENAFTYPNDPMNLRDFTGLTAALDVAIFGANLLISALVFGATAWACTALVFACWQIGSVISGIGNLIEQIVDSVIRTGNIVPAGGIDVEEVLAAIIAGALTGVVSGAVLRGLVVKMRESLRDLATFVGEQVIEKKISLPIARNVVRSLSRNQKSPIKKPKTVKPNISNPSIRVAECWG
jgi:hypothetical protein